MTAVKCRPEGLLLGPTRAESEARLREIRRRHRAAMQVIHEIGSEQERVLLLASVVAPRAALREAIREIDAALADGAEHANFDLREA